MNQAAIALARLHNQHLARTRLATPAEVVARLGAVQAQDFAGAKWAVGLRLLEATDRAVEQAFDEGALLRTHLLRPTWHFVTPRDISWLLTLTAPRVHTVNATMYRQLELDGATFRRSEAALIKALRGGHTLTRPELARRLAQAGVQAASGLRLTYLMMRAELDGVVCSGPRRGKQFTYALLDERAPQALWLERDAALAELSQRYFLSRGPATVADYAKWSGLTLTEARRGVESVAGLLHPETGDGQVYWSAAAPAPRLPSPTVHLLSIYDEYISGYKDRGAIGTPEVGARLRALGNALSYVLLIDGRLVGTWKRTRTSRAVSITASPFQALTPAQNRAVSAAAQRYGAFLELPAAVSIAKPA